MKVIFMGTPQFALPCLTCIMQAGHRVEAVFTQPDRPRGRGYRLEPPAVKVYALKYGFPVYQPENMHDGNALQIINTLAPEVIVVVAYGKILPPEILDAPKMGCVNLHASLLPKLRGASPIQSAIVQGDTVTGVTTMRMDEGMDTGDILEQIETPIGPEETAVELQDRLSKIGARLIVSTLEGLSKGTIVSRKQDENSASYAPLLKKEHGRIDWTKSSLEIHNQIRGLQPWPIAVTGLGGRNLKIYKSRILAGIKGDPGQVADAAERLVVCTGDGALELLEIQLEGSKRMQASAMLRGYNIKKNTFLGE